MKGLPRALRMPALALLCALAPALAASPAGAELPFPKDLLSKESSRAGIVLGGPVTLNADTLTYDEVTGVAVAEGNVEVGFGGRTIRADRIRYDSGTGEAEFAGRVHYKDAGDEFTFDRIVINIDTQRGVLYNGSILIGENNYQIASERFEKTGERTFFIRKGSLTTCPCDPEPDWKFKVGRSRVTIDGYAVGKDITFNIKGVPVLWLPWAAFPVKLTRQTGFLLPGFTQSASKGYAVTIPFYWAVSRWSDATLTLEAMTERGYRPEAEYRYVLNPASEGAARASFFHDRKIRDDRYRYFGENVYRSGGGRTVNARWDVASDDRYYEELVDQDILRTGRHIPSRGFAGTRGDGTEQSLSVTWVEDVQGTPDARTVQRLPEYELIAIPGGLGRTGVDAGAAVQVTHFYRREGERELRGRAYAELTRPFILYPSVSLTPFAALDLLWSEPTKEHAASRGAGRAVPGAGAHLSAEWRGDFSGKRGKAYVHAFRPAASFRWIPAVDQSGIPVTDLWSRVGPQREFTFSLSQRLLGISGEKGPSELAVLELEWAIDLGDRRPSDSPYVDPLSPYARTLREQIDIAAGFPEHGGDSSDIYARFQLGPLDGWKFAGQTLFDPETGDVTSSALGGEWAKGKDARVAAEYRLSRTLAEDINGTVAFRPFRFLGMRLAASYSLRDEELTEGAATLTFHPRSECWTAGFVVARKSRPEESSFKLTFALKGIGSFGD